MAYVISHKHLMGFILSTLISLHVKNENFYFYNFLQIFQLKNKLVNFRRRCFQVICQLLSLFTTFSTTLFTTFSTTFSAMFYMTFIMLFFYDVFSNIFYDVFYDFSTTFSMMFSMTFIMPFF
jgi:hypothetical protein